MQVDARILEKLEWPRLVETLVSQAQTDDGRSVCAALEPNLSIEEIERRWSEVAALRNLARTGYFAPIGALAAMQTVFKSVQVGQILGGHELRMVYDVQVAVKKVYAFASDLQNRCAPLKHYKAQLYPMPGLITAIERAVNAEGGLLDTASQELQRIRKQKSSLRQRIEEQLRRMLTGPDFDMYLQDDFFTVRSERYVVPIRLDGRGRIQGSIIDTSTSGQTLFIEPAAIQPLNSELLELEVAEKLEILRIFKDLTDLVRQDSDTIQVNYRTIIELDTRTAEARLALQLDAGPVKIVDKPVLKLVKARHPLIFHAAVAQAGQSASNPGSEYTAESKAESQVVANTIDLVPGQSCLMISGPNAGGKTVALKTVGLLHLMAAGGLLIPADESSEIHLFGRLFLEMGDSQSLQANLSTFSGHILGLKPIVEKAGAKDLVLLDEIAVGTEPQTGSAIAQAILESLTDRSVTSLVTTHFDNLKALAISDKRFRNGSMEYSLKSLKPTYKLLLDIPGQSYGLELAQQMGLPAAIIDRARVLRGVSVSALDGAVHELNVARQTVLEQQDQLKHAQREAESERVRWEQECRLLEETRRQAGQKVAARVKDDVDALKERYEEALAALEVARKEGAASAPGDQASQAKRQAMETLRAMNHKADTLGAPQLALPGRPAQLGELRENLRVYVVPLRKEGLIQKFSENEPDSIEVQVGVVKLRVAVGDLRITGAAQSSYVGKGTGTGSGVGNAGNVAPASVATSKEMPALVLQSPTNTLDLRGMDVDQALEATWIFIDKALLRGEQAIVIIHGHGTDRLKNSIRKAIRDNSPYDLRFRPGEAAEGGDGVTIVGLRG